MTETSHSLRLDKVDRHYSQGEEKLVILDAADFEMQPGEMVALVAPSGAGKSTLLHIAGLLERPNGGEVYINGEACGSLGDQRRTQMRRQSIGFVYQFHHLLPEFSALENVMMPQLIAGLGHKEAAERAQQLLDYMRVGARSSHRPAEMSGGEQQRVAIARAVANSPYVLLADEPTGNLDPTTSESVFQSLMQVVKGQGVAALIATHNLELARHMDRVFALRDGHLEPWSG